MNIKYDGSVAIATGRSRKELHWKNRQVLWGDLVKKLGTHHRTAETFSNFMSAKKSRRDEIKDIGALVGGTLAGGRRKAGSVTSRSLITLDADFAASDFWDTYCMLYNNAALCYSTHSHSAAKPRLRLVIPLKRELLPDEYEPVARKIADYIGIEQFDDTTYQVERLMYWPSAAADADVLSEFQDGPWLDPDGVLKSYRDWRDSSQWPVSDRQQDIIKRDIKKQMDPLAKPGVVGAFCRTYSIADAIEKYLSAYYQSCDVPGRYTYTLGSTAAGLVVYDDKFAFSHHGTDPTSGKLCNAFDLVRLHLFGDKDEESDRKGFQLPSYQAMLDLAAADKQVRRLLGEEKIKDALEDFAGAYQTEEEEPDMDWIANLEIDRKGNILSTVHNVKTILENDPKLKGRIAFNEFSNATDILRPMPWDKEGLKYPREWSDMPDDMAMLRNYLGVEPYQIKGKGLVDDVMETIKNENRYHPIRDYLNNVKWDGTQRAATLFIDYLGAEDTEYTRAVSLKTLCGAVARVFKPGCKFDYTLTLVGDEGVGKSTICEKLGMDWYSGSFNYGMIKQGVRAYEQLHGAWILQTPEMSGLDRDTFELVKGFVTEGRDRARWAYGRKATTVKRQNIFIGNSNNIGFLVRDKGRRRWWPVMTDITKAIKSVHNLSREEVDQLWAEAVERYRAGEALFLPPELEQQARIKQMEHSEVDERTGLILDFLDMLLPENWEEMDTYERRGYIHDNDPLKPKGVVERDRVSVAEIWCEALGGQQKEMTTHNTKFIHKIMADLPEWEKQKTVATRTKNYGRQRGYIRNQQPLVLTSDVNTVNTKQMFVNTKIKER